MQRETGNAGRRRSAALLWAPLARFVDWEAELGERAEAKGRVAFRLRIRPLRRQAGLGLPVRGAAAGASDRDASVLSARRAARPL